MYKGFTYSIFRIQQEANRKIGITFRYLQHN